MTKVITSVQDWQQIRKAIPIDQSVGFVPTMGNLHAGHQALLVKSLAENAITVLSIFVNPTQFNDQSDLEKYPRTFEEDLAMAEKLGVDYIFYPDFEALYPDQYRYQVNENDFSHLLEGMSRPGHFTGMLTVVLKLLNLVKATRAYFGEKDFQQLTLVKGMVNALFLDVEIVACPTVRSKEGLALSSRNKRLSEKEHQLANEFAMGMQHCGSKESLLAFLQERAISIDYVEQWQNRLLAAVHIGKIRLIDNKEIS